MTNDFALMPHWVPPTLSCSSHPSASQSWPRRQEKHFSGNSGPRSGPQFRPAGSEKLQVRAFRTRSGWGNASGRGVPPLVTSWVTWTKLWERGRSACKMQSVPNLFTSQCPFNATQGKPLRAAADLAWPPAACACSARPYSPPSCPEQSAKAGSSPQARPADPSPAPPTPAGLGWGCDLTNGPFGGACSEIPASQPSMAERAGGLE